MCLSHATNKWIIFYELIMRQKLKSLNFRCAKLSKTETGPWKGKKT